MVTSKRMKQWWNLNKDSDIVRQRNKKISENHRDWNHTDEAKEKIRLGHLGKKHTQESKLKMSMSRKGHIFSKEHNKKISIARKGMKLSEETKRKLSNDKKLMWKNMSANDYWGHDRRGENNPNWINGRSLNDYINFTRKFKRHIKNRDNNLCMNCGRHGEKVKLIIHHINANKTMSIPENCITLCCSCHDQAHREFDYWKNIFQQRLSKYYGYNYNDSNIIINIKGGRQKWF